MTPHQNTSLPQYYAVKVDQDHPKFEEFRRRINAMYHTNLAIRLKYYGYRDGRYLNCWHNAPRNTPILTIDEWLEAVEGDKQEVQTVTPTKPEPSRLEVAAMCLQGLLSNPNLKGSNEAYAHDAFAFADELIKQSKQ